MAGYGVSYAAMASVAGVFILTAGAASRPPHPNQPAPAITRKSGRYRVLVERSRVGAEEYGPYWGGGGASPTVVSGLRVWLGRSEVSRIPRGCYRDLSEVDDVKLASTKGGLLVHIEGGDASDGYDAWIRLAGGRVVARSVHWGEFPENSWEKTEYRPGIGPLRPRPPGALAEPAPAVISKELGRYRVKITQSAEPRIVKSDFWGTAAAPAVLVVTGVGILKNGKPLELGVPMSAYDDLANVEQVTLSRAKNGLNLRIRGGIASSMYQAQIKVVNGQVAARSVQSFAFPRGPSEWTEYHDTTPPDE